VQHGVAERGFRQADAALTPRTRAAVERFFDGFELVEPGLVDVSEWRSDHPAGRGESPWVPVGGVGRKPRGPGAGG